MAGRNLIDLSIAFVLFLIIDSIWVQGVAKKFYVMHMRILKGDRPVEIKHNYALLTYVFYAIALVVFVLPHINPKDKLKSAILWGAFSGFVFYAMEDFGTSITLDTQGMFMIVDIIWGAVLFSTVTLIMSIIR